MSRIFNVEVYGLQESVKASGYPMMTYLESQEGDRMLARAKKLGNAKSGSGHDSYLKGIIVQFDWRTPVFLQPQIQRYHFIDIISSQSAMHRITAREEFKYEDFGTYINPVILTEMNRYLESYNKATIQEEKTYYWRKIIENLPQSYLKTARYTTNYLQLKTMYNQRKNHKLDEWKEFCDWCETLPYFKEFCLGGN